MKKGQIFIVIVMLLMVGILSAYKIDMDKMRKGEDVVFSTWGVKYRPSVKETESGEKQTLKKETIKYNKLEIESSGEKISLKVPEDWKYQEILSIKKALEFIMIIFLAKWTLDFIMECLEFVERA